MRISWLDADVIAAAQAALSERASDWEAHFVPDFRSPPPPAGVEVPDWERVTEHVARAERVSTVVREQGLSAAIARFGGSSHAVELATLARAAEQAEALDFGLVAAVLASDIDDKVCYGPFVERLIALGPDKAIPLYERFCEAYAAARSNAANWNARVDALRDGLADAYVLAGRFDDGHALFEVRHREDVNDVAVALSAGRAFLAAGAVARSVHWLGVGAERAESLGRAELAARLHEKVRVLKQRLS
jgi:hypothetical protein